VGGSAALARALERAVHESGGEIRRCTAPRRILTEGDSVLGVETESGDVIRARHFVASGLNPQQTFLQLMDEAHVPKPWRDRAAGFTYNLIAPLFGLNLNLRERPAYDAERSFPQLSKALMVILGLEHYRQYPEIVDCHERGEIPPTVMWGATPTAFDPSQAPPGHHTAFMWEKLPYRLKGDARNWDREKEAHGRAMLKFWAQFAPNLEEAVIDSFTRSALDTERTFPNMREGDLLVGAFTNGQIGHDRPFAGAGLYRGHLKGLYLCGASSHPGGNITGLPGYNCAQVIHADLGLERTWGVE
jgi:phytoene dehydrogenase-like protein